MGILDSVVSFLRHPIDTIQQAVCENSPRSNACGTLTALASAMDGQQARSLAASTFSAQPLPQAPETRVGCSMVMHHTLTPLRIELLLQHTRLPEFRRIEIPERGILCLFGTDCGSSQARTAESSAREVRTGCYIQHMVSRTPPAERLPILEEMHTLPTIKDYDRILRDLEARQPRVGCYIEYHEMRTVEPLQPDAGVAAPARHRH